MPVFNLELRFDNRGALQAVNQINRVTGAANGATRAIDELGDSGSRNGQNLSRMGDTGARAADAISAAMKKAAGQVLALVGAFTAVNKAMDFMNRGLEFNASLEQSQIGIASLITSMVKLQDAQGNLLEGQNKYNAAQEISRGLMEQIQVLGLKTTADSKSIVEGFQAILAPALQAGMALENIPKFAVQGAQALQTLGVPLNQMRTELDALLTGSVNLSQDILAPKLFADVKGNLKEYIQGLRDAGKLEEEIFKRLEPYNLALKDTENTWAAISSNLGEALDKLAGDTSLNYTKAMKQSLSEIQDLIIDTKTGKLSQDFQEIARVLADIQDWIGNKIISSVQTIISYTKDINFFLGSDMGQSALSAFTTALKVASGALAGFAIARAAAFAKDKGAAAITASKEAMDKYKQSVIAAAQAERTAAYAELSRYQMWMQSAQAQRQLMASEQQRQAILAREIQLVNQATAAEQRLAQAQSMSAARAGMGGALKSLVSFMGGPFNAAMIAGGSAFALLASKQSEAEIAADLHASALAKLNEVQKLATEESKNLSESLGAVAEARRLMAIDEATQAMEKYANAIKLLDFSSAVFFSESDLGLQAQELDELAESVRQGETSFQDFANKLGDVYKQLEETGDQSSKLGQRIKEALDLAVKGADTATVIKKLRGEVDAASDSVDKSVSVVKESASAYDELKKAIDALNGSEKENVNTVEGAIKWLEKRNAQTEEGKQKQIEMARAVDENALATLRLRAAELEVEASMGVFMAVSGQATERQIADTNAKLEMLAKVKGMISEYEKQAPKFDVPKPKGRGGGRKSSGSGSSVDPAEAAKKWQELNDQLDQLEGKSTGAAASLNKTLKEIEDTGKTAKKSATEIEALKQAFIDATDTKSLKELNKELLQLEGNTRAVEEIENQEKTDQFRAKLNEIRSLSDDEKNILLGRYEQAIQTQINVKDAQTALDFMKELESLGGEYGETLQLQNQLIEYQGDLYRDKLPSDMQPYIDQWERLKKLENDKSFMGGLERGVRKFGEQYGDLASNVESFTNQMGSSISSTLSDAFMKGKFSAQDFFTSLVSMAAQAASNQFIGMIFKGLFGAIGGAVGSSANYSAGQTATMSANGMQSGYGGWLTGVHGHHKGGIVGVDYSFKRDMPDYVFADAPRFHSGGGYFRKDEYPAILQYGERVLNRDETRGYEAGLASSRQADNANYARIITQLQAQIRDERQYNSGTPQININIENNANADVQAGKMQPDGNGGFSLPIIISQIEQGMVGMAKQGKSPLQKYQQQAYGMNRAGVIARGRGRN